MMTRFLQQVDLGVESCPYPKPKLTADRFLMVTPAFLDACHCPDNVFTDLTEGVDHAKALYQHQAVVEMLRSLGKEVQVFEGQSPDDTFCNNIFATNHRRQLIVGNMFYPARQKEGLRADIRSWFVDEGYEIVEVAAFTQEAAELTGMLIMDHAWNIGFCGISNRCTKDSAAVLQQLFGLDILYTFPISIYHTNVGLSILSGRVAVICPEMFVHEEDVRAMLKMYPDHVIISLDQLKQFSGNVLAVSDQDIVISTAGINALTVEQMRSFDRFGFQLHHVDLSEIEKSGGSMRCLLGEVY